MYACCVRHGVQSSLYSLIEYFVKLVKVTTVCGIKWSEFGLNNGPGGLVCMTV